MVEPNQNTDLITEAASSTGTAYRLREETASGDGKTEYIDMDLVSRVKAGDTNAFSVLVDRYQRPVYGIVSRMVHSREDVDDVVQEVFVSAYTALDRFRGDAKFSTWLYTIAVNKTLNRIKKLGHQRTVSMDDPETGLQLVLKEDKTPLPEDLLQDREKVDAVRKAIDSLPSKQRIVVVLHYFEQYSCEEIAAILKCSVGTVWSRLHYACKKLKGELLWLEQG